MAFSFTNRLPCRKKSILAKVGFDEKGIGNKCRQDVFLFKEAVICTILGAICYKMRCNMPLNAMRFAAKRSAKWCKM